MPESHAPKSDRPLAKELSHLKVFQQYDEQAITQVLACTDEEHHEMGKILFQTGEPFNNSLFILVRGRVGLWGPHGEKYEADPGTVLDLSSYVDGLPFTFTAIALTPITILAVRETEHRDLERVCPMLHRTLMKLIGGRIRAQRIGHQSFAGSMIPSCKGGNVLSPGYLRPGRYAG